VSGAPGAGTLPRIEIKRMKKIFLLIACVAITLGAMAQEIRQPGWLHKDLAQDSIYGVSTDKAYEFLKGRTNSQVLVAVIDSGVDTAHVDLRGVLWTNPKEKPANGKDDDRNNYKDDFYGWSFLGSEKGNVNRDNLELVRLVREGKKKYADPSSRRADSSGYAQYLALAAEYQTKLTQANMGFRSSNTLQQVLDTVLMRLGTTNPTLEQWNAYDPQTIQEANIKAFVRARMQAGSTDFATYKKKEVDESVEHFRSQLSEVLNLDFDPRPVVGDHYDDIKEKYYGISDVTGPNAAHGSHVAGIIAACRNNGIGIDGVADNVKIMIVRAVPDGDERDKDIANAIRYAVDNGAKVINMSFGKAYSPYKNAVDEAVKYAIEHDVLLVHAAGNDMLNLDVKANYPNKRYLDGSGVAGAWLEVGASLPKRGKLSLAAGFSNYGQTTVDLFAPGAEIYSTMPGSNYAYMDGTSMAAPVVAGIAALVRSYFPSLTALQVKEVLMQSVTKVDAPAMLLMESKMVKFSNLSVSGGIVNAYEAVKLAADIAGNNRSAHQGFPVLPPANTGTTSGQPAPVNAHPVVTNIGAPGTTPTIAGVVKEPEQHALTINPPVSGRPIAQMLKDEEYNEEAPDFSLPDLEGNIVKLSDLKGKVVVIDFWATWCVPCLRSFPTMQKAQEKYKDDPQVKFLFIHTMNKVDTATAMVRTLLRKKNYPFHVLMDLADKTTGRSPVSTAFRTVFLPAKMVIDPNGIIRYKLDGWQGKEEEQSGVAQLSAMIEAARRK
jgi:subtilisin family serine protease/thiol-disulfide isomerase/thioredoxin